MQRYIALLRGINVSGRNIIKIDTLIKLFENLGFCNINTYLQSGNVIFENKDESINLLENKISESIYEKFKYDIPVIVLTINDVKKIIENNPYKNLQNFSDFYVTILKEKPNKESIDIKKFKTKATQGEEFLIVDKIIYMNCPNGYRKTKLTNKYFEDMLKVKATTRNWKTINALLQ